MAEQVEVKTTVTEDNNCQKHKSKFIHKVLGLKGLAVIYKALSIFVLLYLVYLVAMVWYLAFKNGDTDRLSSALLTLQLIVTYGFYSLLLITVARVLKTLKKIKHAVEHK